MKFLLTTVILLLLSSFSYSVTLMQLKSIENRKFILIDSQDGTHYKFLELLDQHNGNDAIAISRSDISFCLVKKK